MAQRDVNAWFLEFRRSGSSRAFRRFFDLTASDLSRLAVGLCPPSLEPQDLLQLTYLRAIEQKDRYDETRPVRPWLSGILANISHEERRRGRQQDPSALDASTLDPKKLDPHSSNTADPSAQAQKREAAHDAARGLDQLEQPYRAVVELYTRHGLTPAEIAQALDRPPGTVRSQLHRGLEMLRRTLPAALLPGLALTMLSRDAIAAIRTNIESAASLAPTTAGVLTSWSLGGLLVSLGSFKTLAWASAAAALVLGLGLGWGEPDALISADPHTQDLNPALSSPDALAADVGPDAKAPRRESIPAAERAEPTPVGQPPDPPRLRVRVVRSTDRKPIADIGLWIERSEPRSDPANRWDPVVSRDVVRTDDAGTVLFDDLQPGRWLVGADRCRGAAVVLDSGITDLEIEVPIGVRLTGQVIDPDGTPIPQAQVLGIGNNGPGVELARSDDGGRFVIEHLQPGAFILARASGHAPCGRVKIDASAGNAASVTLRLKSGTLLTGVVRGPEGERVPDAIVITLPSDVGSVSETPEGLSEYSTRPIVLRTDQQGAFRSDMAYTGAVIVAAVDPNDGESAPLVLWQDLIPGQPNPIHMRLPAASTVYGRVVDSSGLPRAGQVVHSQPAQPISGLGYSPFTHGTATTDDDGWYRIPSLRPAPTRVFVQDGRGHPEIQEQVALTEGQATQQDLLLETSALLEVQVIDANGAGLKGWLVRVGPRLHLDGLWSRTDRDGFAFFPATPRQDSEVAAYAPTQIGEEVRFPAAIRSRVRPDGQRVILTIGSTERTGGLRLAIVDDLGQPVADSPYSLMTDTVNFRRRGLSNRDGMIQIEHLPPGEYRLFLSPRHHAAIALLPIKIAPGQTVELTPVRLETGGRIQLDLTLPSYVSVHDLIVTARSDEGGERDFSWSRIDGWQSPILRAGRWTVWVHGPNVQPRFEAISIRAEQEAHLAMEIRAAPERRVEIVSTRPEEWVRGYLRFTRNGGPDTVVARVRIAGSLGTGHPLTVSTGLPDGHYAVEIDLGRFGHWTMPCDVERERVLLALPHGL